MFYCVHYSHLFLSAWFFDHLYMYVYCVYTSIDVCVCVCVLVCVGEAGAKGLWDDGGERVPDLSLPFQQHVQLHVSSTAHTHTHYNSLTHSLT